MQFDLKFYELWSMTCSIIVITMAVIALALNQINSQYSSNDDERGLELHFHFSNLNGGASDQPSIQPSDSGATRLDRFKRAEEASVIPPLRDLKLPEPVTDSASSVLSLSSADYGHTHSSHIKGDAFEKTSVTAVRIPLSVYLTM